MAFTRTELNSFRTDFASAVAKLEKQYKVEIGIGNISYTDQSFTSKLKVTKTVTSTGKKTSMAQVEFNNLCVRFGFTPKDFKKKFSYNGSEFELTGFKPRSPKFPIIATKISDGGSYKLPRRAIQTREFTLS
jgi:hypothetical protein